MSSRRGVWAFVLVITLVGACVFAAAIALRGPSHAHATASQSVLVWNVPSDLVEGEPPRRLFGYGWLRRVNPTVLDAVRTLDRAANDHHVEALVLHIDGVDWGWAKLAEVRDAMLRVPSAGKPVYAVIGAGGDAEYFLASAADLVAVPPPRALQVDGLMASALFFKGHVRQARHSPELRARGQVQVGGRELHAQRDVAESAREALSAVLDDLFAVLVDSLASARRLDRDRVRASDRRRAVHADARARAALVDTLALRGADRLAGARCSRAAATTSRRCRSRATREREPSHTSQRYVVAAGTMSTGQEPLRADGRPDPGLGDAVATLRDADERPSIKAVRAAHRQPGRRRARLGRDLARGRAAERPQAGDRQHVGPRRLGRLLHRGRPPTSIVAQPGTITGSIGVFAGKFNLLGLYRKLGLNVETVSRGRNAEMMSSFRDFDADEAARFQAQVDTTYQLFLRRVSAGRRIGLAEADSVARGRIWSGRAAIGEGLADTLGGIATACQIALERARLTSDEAIDVEEYPRPSHTFLDRMLQAWMSEEGPSDDASAQGMTPVFRAWLVSASFPAGRMMTVLPWSITVR